LVNSPEELKTKVANIDNENGTKCHQHVMNGIKEMFTVKTAGKI